MPPPELLPEFDRDSLPVLGKGVWGTVLDMQDGTVIKLCKRRGGIGDGVEKARREVAVLMALENRKEHFTKLEFPRLEGHGETDSNSDLGREGFSYWVRLSKMDVSFMSQERFEEMTGSQKENFARSLGEAMAEFHKVFEDYPFETPPALSRKETGLQEIKSYTPQQGDHDIADKLAGKFRDAFNRTTPVFGHGDLNFSNMAVDEGGNVKGFIDFAESFHTLPEAEVSHFLSESDFTAKVIAHYETASGRKMDKEFLELCAANNALFGAVICEFCINEPDEARQARHWLPKHLSNLGL